MKIDPLHFKVNERQTLYDVHSPKNCQGSTCLIHNPSDHHMRDWQLEWREDRHCFERICACGVGHPDPDDIGHDGIHGCCGCCCPPKS